ncbi:hypothetical protein BJN34_32870 [Cupriavidus necator]|uniref:AMP-dependent synthetase/ligase domain-containing protein n=1 Tax=Cupriavidus necator TaxID=106590 RepID=A0A1U9V166_CUPNE|nr:AMP-binding protein [Cupriavidus necator]AQV98672.1 hypothetical protein BJN34_32870 [Cupriavidus necator]
MFPSIPYPDPCAHGVPTAVQGTCATLLCGLATQAEACPDEVAIDYHGRRLSYRALFDASLSLAGYLQQHLGVRRGDRVLLLMHECPQLAMAAQAILHCGAEAVALAPLSCADAVAACVSDVAACAAVTMQDGLSRVAPLLCAQGLRGCIVGAYSEFAGEPGSQAWLDAPEHVREPRVPLLQPRVHDFAGALAAGIAPAPVSAAGSGPGAALPACGRCRPETRSTARLPNNCSTKPEWSINHESA